VEKSNDVDVKQQRAAWTKDSILEIYSASNKQWHVAHVVWVAQSSVGPDVLTVLFYQDDGAKNKSVYRNDHQMAPLGTHTAGLLPPGSRAVSSQSRPGQSSFLDIATGVKYETVEQVWRVHFERLALTSAPANTATATSAGVCALAAPAAAPPPHVSNLMPTPSFPLEGPPDCPALAGVFDNMLPHMQAHMGPSAAAWAVSAAAHAPRDPACGGKVALPEFEGRPPDDEMLVTSGMNLAAQLMGSNASAYVPCTNSATVRKFEIIR
jgi:hypothetical protein